MRSSPIIEFVRGREILDSRGNPTVEVDVHISGGIIGRASVPSGASRGEYEALEIRDIDSSRFNGKGVISAIKNIEGELANVIYGQSIGDQRVIDRLMCELDGTVQKSRLGGNSILGISMAVSDAGAKAQGLDLFRYIGGISKYRLPVPMVNVINGGVHADNGIDIQEFMIMPIGFDKFSEGLRACAEIFHFLKEGLRDKGYRVNVGDEGGFAPDIENSREALDILVEAVDKSGYRLGEEIFFALDVAASELMEGELYHLLGEGAKLDSDGMVDYLAGMVDDYPIISIEDGMGQNDEKGWRAITDVLGEKILLVGDDVFVTSTGRVQKGIEDRVANAVLIKANQVGTLSETIDTVNLANDAGYFTIMSHRSGETEDTCIADYAVGLGCQGIKTGSVSRSERLSKYNRLLRIEETLGREAVYAGEIWQNRRKGYL